MAKGGEMKTIRRIMTVLAVVVLVPGGLVLDGRAAGAGPAAHAAQAGPAARAAPTVDPAFPSSWPQWRPRLQNPANRSRLALDAQYSGGDGSPVWLWGANGGDAQLWVQENASEGGAFLHPGYNRWLCLGVYSTGWGSPVYVQNCNGSANQRWWIDWNAAEIRNVPENLCIDAPGSNFAAGQQLQIWGCNHSAAQRWIRHAPGRSNNASRPVYFVPGYTFAERHDCNEVWGGAISAMRSWGWTGTAHTTGHYTGDVNCNTQLTRGTVRIPIEELGRLLAWNIYNSYSRYRIPVDIVTHSMGGLVARAAIAGVRTGQPESNNWPPYLYVEDVATLSTPHSGTPRAGMLTCYDWDTQCMEMREDSGFIGGLAQNPQSTQGTDWTLIGTEDDDLVPVDHAVGMSAGHKVKFLCCHGGLEHNDLPHTTTGSYPIVYWNYYDPSYWYSLASGAPPVRTAWNAIYYWSDW
jgi:hypothetical protein